MQPWPPLMSKFIVSNSVRPLNFFSPRLITKFTSQRFTVSQTCLNRRTAREPSKRNNLSPPHYFLSSPTSAGQDRRAFWTSLVAFRTAVLALIAINNRRGRRLPFLFTRVCACTANTSGMENSSETPHLMPATCPALPDSGTDDCFFSALLIK